MRSRYAAPVLAAAFVLALTLGSCGVGDGLRVEGSATPVTSATPKPRTVAQTPEIRIADSVQPLTAQALRKVLLFDATVEPEIQDVVRTCVWACVKAGPLLAPGGDALPKQIVTVTTAEGSAFVLFLIDDLVGGPKVRWTLEGDYMRVSVGKGPVLVVESSVFEQDDKACCPSGSKVGIYKWNRKRIVQVSEEFR